MTDQITLNGTTVNAPDALAVAEFYAEITGGVAKGTSHWADHCVVYADLAAHPFCLSTWDGRRLVDDSDDNAG